MKMLSSRAEAVITIVSVHEDLHTPGAQALIAAVLPNLDPAGATFQVSLVRQFVVSHGAQAGKTYMQAVRAHLADRKARSDYPGVVADLANMVS